MKKHTINVFLVIFIITTLISSTFLPVVSMYNEIRVAENQAENMQVCQKNLYNSFYAGKDLTPKKKLK
ncbi:MAG: hypothetical protein ACTSYH_03285 [Candidatus Heimdallarchaeaceae archaeon]